jgi:hypothetical protein
MSLALALARGLVLTTDERKARRLFLEAARDVKRLTSTSELLRQWAEAESVTADRLKAVYYKSRGERDTNHRPTILTISGGLMPLDRKKVLD